jgi:hypothetical protein
MDPINPNAKPSKPKTLFELFNAGKPKNVPLLAAEAMGYFTVTVHTTNTTIAYMLGYIISHPSVHARLKEELNALAYNTRGKLTYDDLRKSECLVSSSCPPLTICLR